MPYMNVDAGQFTLISRPSDDDPLLQRVRAIRVRDQLFIDGLQDNYAQFSEQMDESYLMLQKQSLFEIQARREATRKALGQAAGGVLLIGLAEAVERNLHLFAVVTPQVDDVAVQLDLLQVSVLPRPGDEERIDGDRITAEVGDLPVLVPDDRPLFECRRVRRRRNCRHRDEQQAHRQ